MGEFVLGLFGLFVFFSSSVLLGPFMLFPLKVLKILGNKGNSRTDDESD